MHDETHPARSSNTLRSRTGRWRGRTALALIAGLALAAVPGCGGDDRRDAPGSEEREGNGSIRVDSAKITGRLQQGQVLARIPVQSLRDGAGSIDVRDRHVIRATLHDAE